MQIIMETIMQLMKISLVPYKEKNYVKNKAHKEKDYLEVFEWCVQREEFQNIVLRCLESFRMILIIFTLC